MSEARWSGSCSSAVRMPEWSAFDIRMMFQGYLELGFVAEAGDVEALTNLLGHPPRRYEDFARETALHRQEQALTV